MIGISISLGAFAKSADKQTLVMAQQIDNLITLDPAALFETAAQEYAYNTYQRLLNPHKDNPGQFTSDIVRTWDVFDSGRSYIFRLFPKLYFASGNPLTAHDVVFSLRRAIRLNKAPAFLLTQFGFDSQNIEHRIIAVDNTTVKISLSETVAPSLFYSCLTSPVASIVDSVLLQPHLAQDHGHMWLSKNYAGSGPYKLHAWQANNSLVLVKNEQNIQASKAKLAKIIIRHIKEPSTQHLLLDKGDIDIARNLLSFNNLPADTTKVSVLRNWLKYLALNQNNSYLSKPEVILAIKHLIDYQQIADTILRDEVVVNQSFIPLKVMGSKYNDFYQYDLIKAKELLATAGFEAGFSINLVAKNLKLAQAIQSALAQADIKVNIIPGDSRQVLAKFRARDFDMLIATWASDYSDPHANTVAFATNPDNSSASTSKTLAWRTNWQQPEFNIISEEAKKELDSQKRANLYESLQKEFLQIAPIIVLFQEVETSVINNNVSGFELGTDSNATNYLHISKL